MSAEASHVPVLIIGGGIVGLSASLLLSHYGIHSLLVERHSSTSIHPRARSANARTMEIYRSIGISDQIRAAGAALAPSFGIYSGTTLKEVIEPKPRRVEGGKGPAVLRLMSEMGPERGTFVTQDEVEPVLLKAARERRGDVRFYTECLGIKQDDSKVTAQLRDRESGAVTTVTADYLIAADGANSPIRTRLGVATTGRGSMGHLLNILFTADLGDFVSAREFSICVVSNPEVAGVFTSINNRDRWVFHLHYVPSSTSPATHAASDSDSFPPARCIDLLRLALGMPDLTISILSILPWQPSERVATQLRIGRVFLAGDAAHQMPPYAGQGANSGIADVQNLAWKIAAVLDGGAGEQLLDSYEGERLEVGRKAARVSAGRTDERGLIQTGFNLRTIPGMVRMLPLVTGFGYVYGSGSNAVVEESTAPLGGASWRAWSAPSLLLSLDGRPGSRAPHVWVERGGKRISTIDLFGHGFVLLTGCQGDAWVEASQEFRTMQGGGVELICYRVGVAGDIVDSNRSWEIAAGIASNGALLVRPDGFVAWRQRRMPADVQNQLNEALRRILCQGRWGIY